MMVAIYEFHVAGVIGPVVRSALPELEVFSRSAGCTLHGTASERSEIDHLLELIQMLNVNVQRVQITVRKPGSTAGPNR